MQSDCNRIFPITIDYNRIGLNIIWDNVLGEEISASGTESSIKIKLSQKLFHYFLEMEINIEKRLKFFQASPCRNKLQQQQSGGLQREIKTATLLCSERFQMSH